MEINETKPTVISSVDRSDVDFSEKCSLKAREIQSGQNNLIHLVEELKPLLIHNEPEKRDLGMLILSNIISFLPGDFLSSEQLKFISTFYADRLKDHHQVIPAVLKGLTIILQSKHLPDGSVKEVLLALFKNISCQQQQQQDRHRIYELFEIVLKNRLPGYYPIPVNIKHNFLILEVLSLEFDFIYGFISSMDGERDPRNLAFLFSFLPSFLKNVKLGHLSEEMFEVIGCYFPIDFRASVQENDISRESLANGLCKCLTCTPQFAEFCIPLALEKLVSSLRIAKLDSLNVLAEGCTHFATSCYLQHFTEIWSLIQKELFGYQDAELEKACTDALLLVIKKISDGDQDVFMKNIRNVIDSLKGNLLPESQFLKPTTKILFTIAQATLESCKIVLNEVIPLLINTYNITTLSGQKADLLKLMVRFVSIYDNFNESNEKLPSAIEAIPNLCMKAVVSQEEALQIAGLETLAMICKHITVDSREILYKNLEVFMKSSLQEKMQNASNGCFKAFATNYNYEILRLVQSIKPGNGIYLKNYLSAVCEIATLETCSEEMCTILLNYCLADLDTVVIAIDYMKNVVETNRSVNEFLIFKNDFIQKSVEWFLQHLSEINIDKSEHKELLLNASDIYKMLIQNQKIESQKEIVARAMATISPIYGRTRNICLIFLFYGLLSRIQQNVLPDTSIIKELTQVALNQENCLVQEAACQLLCNILNKLPQGDELYANLDYIAEQCNFIEEYSLNNVIYIISWVTKALVARNDLYSERWAKKLFQLSLQHAEATVGFRIIMDDSYDCLSPETYPNKRVLYRQKFFIESSTEMIKNFEENQNCLLAIGYLIEKAPISVVALHFNKISRMVILCLEHCTDLGVLCGVLETLKVLIEKNEPAVEEHFQALLTRFLKLASFKTSMKVRILALQCLSCCAVQYPVYKLLPHRQDVLYGLSNCVDDPKRLVRKEAVNTRLKWFMLDAPT